MSEDQLRKFLNRVVESAKIWRKDTLLTLLTRDECNSKDDVWAVIVMDVGAGIPESMLDELFRDESSVKELVCRALLRTARELPELLHQDARHQVDQEEAKLREKMKKDDWIKVYPLNEE